MFHMPMWLTLMLTARFVASFRPEIEQFVGMNHKAEENPVKTYLEEEMTVWDEGFAKVKNESDEFHELRGVNHVTRIVADVHKSKNFYHDFLGLAILGRPNFARDGYWLDFGNLQLHLIEAEDHQHAASEAAHNESCFPGSSSHIALHAHDFPDTEMWIQKLGHPYEKFAFPDAENVQLEQLFLKDPDGHIIGIVSSGLLLDVPLADRSRKNAIPKAKFTPDVLVSHWSGNGSSLKGHFRGVHHLTIPTKDVHTSSRFYHNYLQLPELKREGDQAIVVGTGGLELHLIKETAAGQAKIEAQHDTRPGVPQGNVNHLAFGITEFEAVQARLDKDNVTYLKVHVPVGKKAIQQLFVQDPDGNYVELCSCYLLSKFVYGGLDPEASYQAANELASSYLEGVGSKLGDEKPASKIKEKSAAVGKAVLPALTLLLMSLLRA